MLYDSSEKYYNELAGSYEATAAPKSDYINSINRIVCKEAKGRVTTYLDIGCGDGRRTKEIIDSIQPEASTLVDTSHEMISLARQNVPGVSLFCLDPLTLGGETKFAVITSLWNVIGHFPNFEYKKKFFQKVHNLLRDDGIFIFDVNNRFNVGHYGLVAVLKNIVWDVIFGTRSGFFDLKLAGKARTRVYIHKPNELENYIANAKLELVKKLYVNYSDGKIENSPFKGQVVYILRKGK